MLARNVFVVKSDKHFRHVVTAVPYTHLNRQKENWRKLAADTKRLELACTLGVGIVKDPFYFLRPCSQEMPQGRPCFQAFDWHFQLGGFLVAESDLKILGSVPGIFQESTPARKGVDIVLLRSGN